MNNPTTLVQSTDHSYTVGTIFGTLSAMFAEKLFTFVGWSSDAIAFITTDPDVRIIVNAAIGATVGFLVTALWKWLFEKIKKWRKKK